MHEGTVEEMERTYLQKGKVIILQHSGPVASSGRVLSITWEWSQFKHVAEFGYS